MANQHTVKAERQTLQQQSVNQWERERRQRVEALCAAITAQRTAASKLGNAHVRDRVISDAMGSALAGLHEELREVVDEENPFEHLPLTVGYDGKQWMVHGHEYAGGAKTGKWVLKRAPEDRRRRSYDWANVDPSDCEITEEGWT